MCLFRILLKILYRRKVIFVLILWLKDATKLRFNDNFFANAVVFNWIATAWEHSYLTMAIQTFSSRILGGFQKSLKIVTFGKLNDGIKSVFLLHDDMRLNICASKICECAHKGILCPTCCRIWISVLFLLFPINIFCSVDYVLINMVKLTFLSHDRWEWQVLYCYYLML